MAGESAERQETGLVNAINKAFSSNKKNPITLLAGKTKITGVINASKFSGRQASGSEPYTDVVIKLYNGKSYNLSLKGDSAPSLAGGGLRGLEFAVPGIAKKFMVGAQKHLIQKLKLAPGDKVPDVYGKINSAEKLKVVLGNVAMGGPIDFMFIGRMDVSSSYNAAKNVLTISNGALIDATHYAKSHELYFRLRARREDQRFDPSAVDKDNTPKIYGKSPSRGDSAGRIVVTDKVPSNAITILI